MPQSEPSGGTPALHLYRWADPVVIGVVLAAFAAGFGQFGVVAALGKVAKEFGHSTQGTTIADQAGLSGTALGIGLAIIRLASLGALLLTGMADRLGRRTMLLVTVGIGLAITAVAAASPGYWWFVVIFALGRPFLSATNSLTAVLAAEQTGAADRAKAVAFVAAGYGIGAGLIALLSLASSRLGFRGIFALALIPLALLPIIARQATESDRFAVAAAAKEHPLPVIGAVGRRFRGRLSVLVVLAFAISVITGPANTFAYLYAENVLHQPAVLTGLMVVGAGATGLVGLLIGRWSADHIGRRPTGAVGMVGIAVFGAIAYSGSRAALVVGYCLGVLAGSLLAPSVGSMLTELFPTSVRASVAGWWLVAGVIGAAVGLVVFGAVADIGNRFGLAALATFLPASLGAALFWCLPETRGTEPEELWPES